MAKELPYFKNSLFQSYGTGAPTLKGVYAICIYRRQKGSYPPELREGFVVYIGSSYNIRMRLQSPKHIFRRLYNILKSYEVRAYFYPCDNHEQVERFFINLYNPRFNKIKYNG